ncbi:FMN reductase [Streptomyces sp. NRRL F-5135]|uniref:FMN reductase n=1 Tax=Streptomyces sp. NRRL F-5135 TaxID=1463858 RepID=UPI003B641ECB
MTMAEQTPETPVARGTAGGPGRTEAAVAPGTAGAAGAAAPVRVVAVSAGLGEPSSTRLLADRLAEATTRELAAEDRKAEVTVVELRGLAVDIAHHLVTGFPSPALRAALDTVTGADGLIAVTPVFAASYSGLFKSFFDLVDPDALTGTPVLLAATGGTPRHSLAVEHAMRPLFSYLRAPTLPTAVFAATDDWGGGADAYAGGLPARIARAGEEFARLLRGRGGGRGDGPGANEASTGVRDEYDPDTVVPFEQLLARRTAD